MGKPGRIKGQSNHKINRYAGVKLRQRIAQEINSGSSMKAMRMFKCFASQSWLPTNSGGDIMSYSGFFRHYSIVAKGGRNIYSNFFICFCYRANLKSYTEYHRRVPYKSYNGLIDLSKFLGVHQTIIKDVLILEGEIE